MKKWTYNLLFILLLSLLLQGCGDNETAIEKTMNTGQEDDTSEQNLESENNNTNSGDEDMTQLAIGESVQFEETTITLNDVRLEKGSDLEKPKNDYFLIATLTAENHSADQEVIISSLLNVKLIDGEKNTYSAAILTEGVDDYLDGSLDAGEKMTGDIPFDVPESDSYDLHFTNPFQKGEAVWIIDPSEL